jgi:exopolysaccharide biosynthesis polyprenyl glycosylphosphotransferase
MTGTLVRAGGGTIPRPARWRRALRRPELLVATDVTALVLAIAVGGTVTTNTAGIVAFSVGMLALGGLYRARLAPAVLDEAPSIIGRLLVAVVLTAALRRVDGQSDLVLADRARVLLSMVAFVLLGRSAVYGVVRRLNRRDDGRRRALVLGAGLVGAGIAAALRDDRRYGLEPVAFVDPDPPDPDALELPLIRDSELAAAVSSTGARVVVVAFAKVREQQLVDLIRSCHGLDVEIYLVPRLFELHAVVASDIEDIRGFPVVRLRRQANRSPSWRLKRAMDITIAGLLLLASVPCLALAALLVRTETGGPALFRQQRVGLDGRRFTIYKLRTVRPDATHDSETLWSVAGSGSVGPVGRFLRASSIDELPQLWNVVRGDMSLVGPRPERPHFVSQFSERYPHYAFRHRVPCGLTGLAQINGLRGDTSIDERARFDNVYIEHWSLWTDVKILLRTGTTVLTRRGS